MSENSRKNSEFNDEQFRIVKSRFNGLPTLVSSQKSAMHTKAAQLKLLRESSCGFQSKA
jgi:hypothetical protein